jgi:hypothetical protein
MSILKLVGVGLFGAGCVVSAMMYQQSSSSSCCSAGKGCMVSDAPVSCCDSVGASCSECPASCSECPSGGASCGDECPASRNQASVADVSDISVTSEINEAATQVDIVDAPAAELVTTDADNSANKE